MDFEAIKKAAQAYGPDMTRFLRDMICHPQRELRGEGASSTASRRRWRSWAMTRWRSTVSATSSAGWATGDKIIAIDSHIDTVGIGNLYNWEADPYEGYED